MKSLLSKIFKRLRNDGPIQLFYSAMSFLERRFCKREVYYEYKKEKFARKCKPQTDADPLKLVWVSPEDIKYLTGSVESGPSSYHLDHVDFFKGLETFGDVKWGKWDSKEDIFEELAVYQALEQRFIEGKAWEDTEFYRIHLHRIEEYGESYDSQSEDELRKKLQVTEELYKNIKENGYKTQQQLSTCKPYKEITVNVGRDGTFLFNGGGRHRLSIAKLLKLNEIPVIIKVRHEHWQSIRDQIINAEAESQLSNNIRLELKHPDIENIDPR